MKELPNEINAILKQKGLPFHNIIYWMACDRRISGGFSDTFLILSRDTLYILSNNEELVKNKFFNRVDASSIDSNKSIHKEKYKMKVEQIRLEEIEEIRIVKLVSSGMLIIKTTKQRSLAAFTNGLMGKAIKFVSIFSKIKKNEVIDGLEELNSDSEENICPNCGIYLENESVICPNCTDKITIFKRVIGLLINYKSSIFFIILFMLLNSATGLLIPYMQGTVLFDQALGGTGTFAGKIGLVIFLIIVFRTISLLFGIFFGIINAKLAAKVFFDLKANIFSAMQRLSLAFFNKKQTGQLITRVNNDASDLQYFFVAGFSYFIVNAMNILGITIILFILDWKLTLICFIPLPIVVVLIKLIFPKLVHISGKKHKKLSNLNSIISDALRGIRIIKAFGKEKEEMERFQKANVSLSEVEQSVNKMNSTYLPILALITQIGGILVWACGGWKVINGEFALGKLITFVSYISLLYGPVQTMNSTVSWWSYCMSAAQRIFEIQDAIPEISERQNAIQKEEIIGHIHVSNVTFEYETNNPILKDVSLLAKPGQMIGILGKSGAGKSTIVNLISRLYDVTDGAIYLDGVNVKDLSTDSLRKNIGIVTQETYLFTGTIAENIAYANPRCSILDIINAAKVANAHEFIIKLPDGYDTIVGTEGYSLSGGEKQRISIARAVLHNPKILILDEASASLDTETELKIQEALDMLIKGRTTIAIAHRLSTLRSADYLYVMKDGKMVEEGSHKELLSKDGIYANMVKKHEKSLKIKEVV